MTSNAYGNLCRADFDTLVERIGTFLPDSKSIEMNQPFVILRNFA